MSSLLKKKYIKEISSWKTKLLRIEMLEFMEWRCPGSAELKSAEGHNQIKDQIQYMVHSLEIVSYFSLLTQSYVYR